eukprot:CAMPEP_0114494046 /NCGR_PEP_ID=MMETSP0109-20121206/4438_1 /TAXON_ID=29199 /ORGANISM="Chlorarachnion reptans, Strain CCCM449" /LENGTH=309 /DNA_ID=CAMNT_0001671047 /DNA_START=250 /DNA_END=1179 /DNA_ORIENTATION=-
MGKILIIPNRPFTGVCTNKWKNVRQYVRPTQHDVGYAWVQKKTEKDFDSQTDAQDAIDGKIIPAVLGPNNVTGGYAYYVIDAHHTVAALDYSGYEDTHVKLTVLCDSRDMGYEDFLQKLSDYNLDYQLAHPSPDAQSVKISTDQLPIKFSFTVDDKSFGDDRWRSIAGFSRKIKNDECTDYKYCMRCFIRGCNSAGKSVPFVEYKWSYFFVDALTDSSLWPSSNEYDEFKQKYESLPACVMGEIDTSAWEDAAKAIIPLCRGDAAGKYQLPTSLFKSGGGLPGYTEGKTQLPKDPDCEAPVCPYPQFQN